MVEPERPFISARGLGKFFGTGEARVDALTEINLEIFSGKFTVILGPSGSGKTTLLNIIGGMDSPSSGTTRVGSDELDRLSARELTRYRRTRVGFVFQFYNLIPNLTAAENVALAASLVMPRHEAGDLAHELLERVGLGHRLNQFPRQLSGGEMQRVAVARALAKRPVLLLCDEPSGALDSRTGAQVLGQLQSVAHETGTAVVVVTHEQALAAAADQLIRLADGRIVEDTHNARPQMIGQEFLA